MKLITFTVPCYNSAAYMDRCVETLLPAGEEAEIILVDDGSKDDAGKIADAYAEKYPNIVKVIHQESATQVVCTSKSWTLTTGWMPKLCKRTCRPCAVLPPWSSRWTC